MAAGVSKVRALQMWCRARTEGYPDVEICDMTSSWKSGLAFCALIHRYRPDLIDFEKLSKDNIYENNKLAFEVAESVLGVPALLDAEDMVRMAEPDKFSVVTYVAQLYQCFQDKKPEGRPPAGPKKFQLDSPLASDQLSSEAKRPSSLMLADKDQQDISPRKSAVDSCTACGERVFAVHRRQDAAGRLHHASCLERSQSSPAIRRSWTREPATGVQTPVINGQMTMANGQSTPGTANSPIIDGHRSPLSTAVTSSSQQPSRSQASRLSTGEAEHSNSSGSGVEAAGSSSPGRSYPVPTPRTAGPAAAVPAFASPRGFTPHHRPQPATRQVSVPIMSSAQSSLQSPPGRSDSPSAVATFATVNNTNVSTMPTSDRGPLGRVAVASPAGTNSSCASAPSSEALDRPRAATVMRSKSDAVRNLSSVLRRSIAGDHRDAPVRPVWRPVSATSLGNDADIQEASTVTAKAVPATPTGTVAAATVATPDANKCSSLESEQLADLPSAIESQTLSDSKAAAAVPIGQPVVFQLSTESCIDSEPGDSATIVWQSTVAASSASHPDVTAAAGESCSVHQLPSASSDSASRTVAASCLGNNPETSVTATVQCIVADSALSASLESVPEDCEADISESLPSRCQELASSPAEGSDADTSDTSLPKDGAEAELLVNNGGTLSGGPGYSAECTVVERGHRNGAAEVEQKLSTCKESDADTDQDSCSGNTNTSSETRSRESSGDYGDDYDDDDGVQHGGGSQQTDPSAAGLQAAQLSATGQSCRDLSTIPEVSMEQSEHDLPTGCRSPSAVAAATAADSTNTDSHDAELNAGAVQAPPRTSKTATEALLEEVLAASSHGTLSLDVEGKSLSTAAKVDAELSRIDKELHGLEAQSQKLAIEMQLPGSENGTNSRLVDQLLETVNRKNLLLRRESELICLSKQCALEIRQMELDCLLRRFLTKPENQKTEEERRLESKLLEEKVQLVEERHKLVMSLDDERLRKKRTLDCLLCSHHAREAPLINSR